MNIPPILTEIANIIHNAGGRAYLVGGTVTDFYLGIEPKDWDIEVFGIEFPALKEILKETGFNPKLVGQSFGVLKINVGLEIDISVPRKDNKVGICRCDK